MCKDSKYFVNRKIKHKIILKGPRIERMKRIDKGRRNATLRNATLRPSGQRML